MMHDVEERLRDALQRHADEAPAGLSMLAAVESAASRRRRRLATSTAAVALLVVAGAAVPFTLRQPPPPAVVSAPPVMSALVDSTVPTAVLFPFTPRDARAPIVWLAGGLPTLHQQLDGGDGVTVTASVSTSRPVLPSPTSRTNSATVRGHAATVIDWTYADVDAGQQRSLVWQEDPATWVDLRTEPAAVPVERLMAFAEALRAEPSTGPVPFTFALMPAGYAVDNINPTVVTFRPSDAPPDQGFLNKIAVMLSSDQAAAPAGTRVQAGSKPAWLSTSDEATILQVSLGDGRLLVIQLEGRATLAEPDLLRFAAGIAVTPDAQPGNG